VIFRLLNQVKKEIVRRSIPLTLLEQVLNNPQQIVIEKGKLKAYQSIILFDDGRTFLLRAIVDEP